MPLRHLQRSRAVKCRVLALVSLTASCSPAADSRAGEPPRELLVAAPDLPVESLDQVSARPSGVITRARGSGRNLTIVLAAGAKAELSTPNACPLSVDANVNRAEWRFEPRIRLFGPAGEVGYDARFEVTLRSPCPTRAPGTVAWEVNGAPLESFTTLDGGYRVVGRTGPAPARFGDARPGQLVSV